MKLERIDINSQENAELYKQRKSHFGNSIGTWICDKCAHSINSFLHNFENHIPEDCPNCQTGKMIEDENKRFVQKTVNMIDRSREKNWEQGLNPMQQASVLLGETDPY